MKKLLAFSATFFVYISTFCQGYTTATFTSVDRLQKIEKTFPVVDALFKAQAEKAHYPGLVWGLVVDGKLVHIGSTGYANVQKKIAAGSNSVFRIASMTKSFTAMAILKLRDEGKLNLDDPASKYIPEMKNLRYATTDARPITIRDLLTHRAGFPEDNPWGDRQLADSDEELLSMMKNGVSFSNVPGIAYEYSNFGFALLGTVVSNVSKQPYDQYITQNILKPLGMNHTYWEYTKVPDLQLARGYRWINSTWRDEALLGHGSFGAMGGLMTTIEDFAKYVAFHLSAWPPNNSPDNGPIKRSSLREMHQPWNFGSLNANFKYPGGRACAMASAYGYGLRWERDCQDRTYVGHSGGLPGFGSQWRILPEFGIGIISFANLTYAGTGNVNLQVLDTIIALAELKARVVPPSAILNQRKSELVKLLSEWKNAEKSGIFAENFFADYIIDSLRKEASNIFKRIGSIKSIGEMTAVNQLRGSFVLMGENAEAEVWFTLTPENPPLIQEYRIRFLPKKTN